MKRLAGLFAATIFVASVVAANYLTAHLGLIPVGFGLTATAGTIAIGGAIMTRDLMQDGLGRGAVIVAILIGAVLSWWLSSPELARASAITFLIAELLEFAVYTPLRRRVRFASGQWSGVVLLANITGALADTLIFLSLAGFSLTAAVVAGQMVGKGYVTLAVVILAGVGGLVVRRPVPEPTA